MDKVEFRNKLLISYLSDVAALDNPTEFQKFFPEIESNLAGTISKSNDLDFLNKIKKVIFYQMNKVKKK